MKNEAEWLIHESLPETESNGSKLCKTKSLQFGAQIPVSFAAEITQVGWAVQSPLEYQETAQTVVFLFVHAF